MANNGLKGDALFGAPLNDDNDNDNDNSENNIKKAQRIVYSPRETFFAMVGALRAALLIWLVLAAAMVGFILLLKLVWHF
jgi:hypothetical protein